MENAIDITILVIGTFLLFKGFFRGFIKEIFSLGYVLFIIFFFQKILPYMVFLKPYFHKFYFLAALGLIYIIFIILGFIIRTIIKKLGAKNFEKSIVDRTFGILLGLAQGVLIVFLLALFSKMGFPTDKYLNNSILIASFIKKTKSRINYTHYQDKLYELIQGNFQCTVNSICTDDKKEGDIKEDKITTAEQLKQALKNNPALNDYFHSPKVIDYIKKGETHKIMSDPQFIKLMMNPESIKVFSRIDLKALRENVGKK